MTDKLTLLDSQREDALFLVQHPHGALFSEAGAGKTLPALEAARQVGGRTVVICPPIAGFMWKEEAERHMGVQAQFIDDSHTKISPDTKFVVMTYNRVSTEAGLRMLVEYNPTALILDESDALKSRKSQRTQAIYGKDCKLMRSQYDGLPPLASVAGYVWPLTGTPIRRYADDLYPQLKALHPDLLRKMRVPSYNGFSKKFCVVTYKKYGNMRYAEPKTTGNRNEAELNDLLYDPSHGIAIRRKLVDVAKHMPPVTVRQVSVSYVPSQELTDATNGIQDLTNHKDPVLATARRLLGVAKADSVADYVQSLLADDAGNNEPVLVLFWHTEVGVALEKALRATGRPLQTKTIQGGMLSRDKKQIADDFNDGLLDILFGQIGAMGVSLNIQKRASRVVFAEADWSPAAMEQALRRVWRMGQEKHVQVDICYANHTVDDAVKRTLAVKEHGQKRIIG